MQKSRGNAGFSFAPPQNLSQRTAWVPRPKIKPLRLFLIWHFLSAVFVWKKARLACAVCLSWQKHLRVSLYKTPLRLPTQLFPEKKTLIQVHFTARWRQRKRYPYKDDTDGGVLALGSAHSGVLHLPERSTSLFNLLTTIYNTSTFTPGSKWRVGELAVLIISIPISLN